MRKSFLEPRGTALESHATRGQHHTTSRYLANLFLILLISAASLAAERLQESVAERWSPYTLFRKPPRAATMVMDGFLWIEAEDFADDGDWRLDTQFVQQMGSAYPPL